MIPYYILIFVPVLVSLLQNRKTIRIGGEARPDAPKGPLTAFFWIYMVLLACRGSANGADWSSYLYYFETIGSFGWSAMWRYKSLEQGYVLLNWCITRFTDNYQVLLATVAVLSVWPVYRFYRREAEAPLLTMFLFVTVAPFSMYFSGLRQILAMAFVYPIWYCAKEKKLLRSILLVLLAMLFHRSAFVLLAVYPLYHVTITRRWLYFVVPAMAAVYLFRGPVFRVLAALLWEGNAGVTDTGATTVLLLLVIFAVYAYLIPDDRKLDRDLLGMRNILLLCITIQCFASVNALAMRMNYYFLPFVPVLIPKLALRSRRRYWKVANLSVAVMTLFFAAYFFRVAYTGADILQVFPYVPFWSE